ncbi:ATP-binding protein, partial [Streptomyces luteogriseus]
MARRPYVLVCDEAQQLSGECFEFVRHLWDTGKGRNRPAVLFVGGEEAYQGPLQRIRLCLPHLYLAGIRADGGDEVRRDISLFQPVRADASGGLVDGVYEVGGGAFRVWSKITCRVLEGR